MKEGDLLFQLKFREEELIRRIKYCEKKRNIVNKFNEEIMWNEKRLDAEHELEDIRNKIKGDK